MDVAGTCLLKAGAEGYADDSARDNAQPEAAIDKESVGALM